MQRNHYFFAPILLILVTICLSSCQAIGDIFKAGVWTGLLLVAAVIAIVIFIIAKLRK